MYGVLIIGVQHFIEEYYGSEIWPVVVERSGLSTLTYQTQKVYSETVIERLIEALGDVTGRTVAELRYQNGLYFAAFTTQHGYDKLLRVQGRSFIHFLRNLDNLHEHLRFSYPKIRPPSFFILSCSLDLINMYGVLVEGLKQYVTKVFGDGLWWVALQHVTGKQKVIQTRQIYPENLLPQMITQLADMTGVSEDELYYEYGYFFLQYLTDSGFESLLRVLGDGFTEFLNALDDLHHHLQFSYPRIKPPAFLIAHMTDTTIDLVYESRRECFGHFVRGQLIAIAGLLYELDVEVELLRCVKKTSTHQFTYRIRNKSGKWPTKKSNLQKAAVMSAIPPESSVHGDSYFSLFPFHLVFTDTLKISSAGAGFQQFIPNLIGQLLSDVLFIVRPKIEITFTRIKLHHHNTFELVLVKDYKLQAGRGISLSQAACKFKGQMCFVEEWNMMLFLGTPV
ncbi:uncharacterized protein DEA37_0007366 [Paragonimus westermani]|uniref:guanylate cyclase n=1 Tax=Paragonimus westermani TaxID=34504 RepID=A0A5J4NQI0_9TREM|nr:uncharacterized protein DEA37_0007366 [Paragonimus westermani]